jgi:lysyl-tRNA synthetase class 2
MLQRARVFFAAEKVLEVDTPALSGSAVSDPHIESVAASLSLDAATEHFLHTSPEYCMKRLLCDGYPDIYQVCKVFRDNEAGRHHQPEFTMVEWYRLNYGLQQISQDTLAFIAATLDEEALAKTAVYLDYADAFRQYADCDPLATDVGMLADLVDAEASLRASVGEDKDTWLDIVLEGLVVPRFAPDRLTVLSHYPFSQAALSRQCPDNPALADRFEIFYGRHELANGYVELTDALEYERRFAADNANRQSRGQALRPLDNDFLGAIHHGLPACAGVAVGFDRLLMIHAQTDDIRKVQTFAFPELR